MRLALVFLLTAGIAAAAPSPLPEADFLNLPATDLEPRSTIDGDVAEGGAFKVGDSIYFQLPGVSAKAKIEYPTLEAQSPAPGASPEPSPKERGTLADNGLELIPVKPDPNAGAESYTFKIVPLKPGALTVPSLLIRDEDGRPVGRTNPVKLQVNSSIAPKDQKPQEPVPMRPPVSLAFPWWIVVLAAIVVIAITVGIVLLIQRWLRKRKEAKEEATAPAPPKPEDEEALAALEDLERQALMKSGRYKIHYFKLSEILKAYLGRRYRFDALESTSHEILAHLDERRSISPELVDRLEKLFEHMDTVKFTDHVPLEAEGVDSLRSVREIVLQTRRPPMLGGTVPPGGASQ